MAVSNLPTPAPTSDSRQRDFFDQYYNKRLSYAANDVDAVVGFFLKRGFEEVAANSVASVLLKQAKIDDVPVFRLLDTLTGLDDIQISALIAEILNHSRNRTSTIGYKTQNVVNLVEARNIEQF